MKYFVFSDVHGCFDAMVKCLKDSGYDETNDNHYLLFLGDAFDHGKNKHFEVYEFLKKGIENHKLTWIMGNHELYLLNNFKENSVGPMTRDTVRCIAIGLDKNSINYSDIECLEVLKNNNVDSFIKNNVVRYFETDKYIFTHGFIPYDKKNNKYDPNFRNIKEEKWNYFHSINGINKVLSGVKLENKTLVCGHIGAYYGNLLKKFPSLYLGSKEFNSISKKVMKNSKIDSSLFHIYYGDGVIGIDGRTYDTNIVNVLVVDSDK